MENYKKYCVLYLTALTFQTKDNCGAPLAKM